MPPPSDDKRSPVAIGYMWASRATSVSLEMVLPILLGLWLDRRWNSSPWIVIIGAVLGFSIALLHLMQMTKPNHKTNRDKK